MDENIDQKNNNHANLYFSHRDYLNDFEVLHFYMFLCVYFYVVE